MTGATENATAEAAAMARDLAEAAHDEIATLRAEVNELRALFRAADSHSEPYGPQTSHGAEIFPKVLFVSREIVAWYAFMNEVRALSQVLAIWRDLDSGLQGSRHG